MQDGVAPFEGIFQPFGLEEMTNNGFAPDAFEVLEVAGFADEEAEVGALRCESMRYMVPTNPVAPVRNTFIASSQVSF